MRKGAVQQVFIYLMVIIIAGAVMLLGYNSISNIIPMGCEVEKNNFVSALERAFTRHERVGTSSVIDLSVPCDYDVLCFANATGTPGDVHQVIKDNIDAGTGMNVFMGQGNNMEALLARNGIQIGESVLCINSSASSFKFRLTGTGRGRLRVDEE